MKDRLSNRQLIINLLSNIVSYSSNIIISFVLTPYLINTLGKEAYSFYPIANTLVSYMSIVVNALNAMASRFITIEIVKKNKDNTNRYFTSILFSNLVLCGVLLLPMLFIVVFADLVMDIPVNMVAAIRVLFSLVFASALINVGTSVFGVATYATNRVDLRSLRELVAAVARILLFVVLFALFRPSIVYVGVVALLVALINFAFQFGYTRILLPDIKIKKKYINLTYIKKILSSGVWNILNQLGNMLLAGTSLVLANMLYGASAAGEYSIVQTVPTFINGIISMLVGVFSPIIIHHYAENNKERMLQEIVKAQKLVGFFACSVIGVFIGLSYEFFSLWTPGEDALWLQLLSTITIMPHILIASVWSLSNLNIVMNRIKVPSLYLLVSGMVNVILAFVIAKFTNIGLVSLPIISTAIQVVWIGIFLPTYPCRKLNISRFYFYPAVIRSGLGCVIVVFLTKWIKGFFVMQNWFALFAVAALTGGLALIVNGLLILNHNERITLMEMFSKRIKHC